MIYVMQIIMHNDIYDTMIYNADNGIYVHCRAVVDHSREHDIRADGAGPGLRFGTGAIISDQDQINNHIRPSLLLLSILFICFPKSVFFVGTGGNSHVFSDMYLTCFFFMCTDMFSVIILICILLCVGILLY